MHLETHHDSIRLDRCADRSFLFLLATSLRADEPKWKQHTINGQSEFEAAGVFDVDNDGKLDIVAGDTWYQAPDWKPYHVRDVKRVGTYYNDFATLPLDVNGDGHTDFVTCSYFGKSVGWVENPGKTGATWTYHEVDVPGNIEAAWMVDLSGDGVPDVLPNTVNVVVWYEVVKKSDGKGVRAQEARPGRARRPDTASARETSTATAAPTCSRPRAGSRHRPIPPTAHGPGTLTGSSARPASRSWRVTSMAMDCPTSSMAWVTTTDCSGCIRTKGSGGERTWTKQTIDNSVASVHALMWADIDGDGKAHELVTGKRVYAHEIEPGATDGSLVAWYAFDPSSKSWVKHVIFQGEPAKNAPAKGGDRLASKDFPPGTAGTGLQMTAIDIDRDGDLDLLCPGKSGLYLFENLRDSR